VDEKMEAAVGIIRMAAEARHVYTPLQERNTGWNIHRLKIC
jgi:hypothetical protein